MISLRLSEREEQVIRTYAKLHGETISEFARKAMMERIEDFLDLQAYYEAMEEFKKDSTTYTLEEVREGLGL